MVDKSIQSIQTLRNVSQILAGQHGIDVRISGSVPTTTYELGKKPVISIPMITSDNPKGLTLLRGYIDHEAAHVRFTDREYVEDLIRRGGQQNDTVHTLGNIFEDAYVERKLGDYFPGSRRNFRDLTTALFGEGDPTVYTAGTPEEYIKTCISNAFNAVRGAGCPRVEASAYDSATTIQTTDPTAYKEMVRILREVNTRTTSTKENYEAAEELWQVIDDSVRRVFGEQPPKPDDQQGDQQDNPSDNSQGGDQSGGGQQGGDQQADAPQGGIPEDKLEDILRKAKAGNFGNDEFLNDMSVKDKIQEQVRDILDEDPGHAYELGNGAGSHGAKNRFSMLGDAAKALALKATAMLDAQLHGLLQTTTLQRDAIGRRGRLDSKSLHKVRVNNPKVFRKNSEKVDTNTDVVICIDCSGSMSGENKDTVASQVLYATMRSLRKLKGVRSGVVAFNSNVDILMDFATPMGNNFNMNPTGGTNCGRAMIEALNLFNKPDARKLIVMITDGQTDGVELFRTTLRLSRASGIEVVGIGIVDHDIKHHIKDAKVIDKLSQFAPTMFELLRNKITNVA